MTSVISTIPLYLFLKESLTLPCIPIPISTYNHPHLLANLNNLTLLPHRLLSPCTYHLLSFKTFSTKYLLSRTIPLSSEYADTVKYLPTLCLPFLANLYYHNNLKHPLNFPISIPLNISVAISSVVCPTSISSITTFLNLAFFKNSSSPLVSPHQSHSLSLPNLSNGGIASEM